MPATLLIILGILGFTLLFFLVGQLFGPHQEERQPTGPPQPIQGTMPYPMAYQPQPVYEERPAPRISLWPIFFLLAIAGVFYLAYRSSSATTKASPVYLKPTEPEPKTNTSAPFEYETPDQLRYEPPRQETATPKYTPPLSTPRTDRERWANNPSAYNEPGPAERKTDTSAAARGAVSYRQGFGVQLFAMEKGWWNEAELSRLQKKYPGLLLLIGKSYGPGKATVNKFLLGPFDTKEAADKFAKGIQKEFSGAYTIELLTLDRVDRYWTVP